MKLRKLRPEDLDALAAIHAASFDSPWPAGDLAELAGGPGAFGLLAEDERVLGFVLVRSIAGEAEVLTLAVDPACRRSGAGQALMRAAMTLARAGGGEAMFLEAAVDNDPALGLYRSLGFETVGRRPGYYRRGGESLDALLLRRTLNSADL